MAADGRLCTFYLDRLWFGIAVERVYEVIRLPAVTRVPLAARAVAGLINLRGQIITVIDLRLRLTVEERPAGMIPVNVVARSENATVGLLVDEIGEVVDASESAYEIAPDNLPAEFRELVPGVYKLPNCLLHVLDLDKVVGGNGSASPSTGSNSQGRPSAVHRRAKR
jgi:purine-binding chemotaxis protein CheW